MLPTTPASTPDVQTTAIPTSRRTKAQRILACVLCQQRKVKCDRSSPCANCVKSGSQCVPATQVNRRRKRRFPERELLDRLRRYEQLLSQNNIKFDPLHPDSTSRKRLEGSDSDDDLPKTSASDRASPATTINSERVYEAKSFWHAMNQQFRDTDGVSDSSEDDVREYEVKKAWDAWDHLFENNDHLLFCSRQISVDISIFHPDPVQIFRLWQVYLENVNPLLKVTHNSTLQSRIIEAASNIKSVNPSLEALMFSIYCVSVLSLSSDECQTMFGSSKIELLTKYMFGCRQALVNYGFLRCEDRDCLTALFLYLVSVRPSTVPTSLSSILGIAIRIAQRMGIHSEASLARFSPLEAEMRRRLWWALVLFDVRIGEMANFRNTTLNPTWDCKIPLNVNDSDLREEMNEVPQIQGSSSEALFAVVRSEVGEFIRHSTFHLDFTTPALKLVVKDIQQSPFSELSELDRLEELIEAKYLRSCNPENPLHFMTIWTAKGFIAKCRLMEYYSKYSNLSAQQLSVERGKAIAHALSMLDCDTKVMTSPLTQRFVWLSHCYFPATAHFYLLSTLKRYPSIDQCESAWQCMSENIAIRFDFIKEGEFMTPFFQLFTRVVLQAWEACEPVLHQSGRMEGTPRLVGMIREKVAQIESNAQHDRPQPPTSADFTLPGFSVPSMPGTFGSGSAFSNVSRPYHYPAAGLGPWAYTDMSGLPALDVDMSQMDWFLMDTDPVSGAVADVSSNNTTIA